MRQLEINSFNDFVRSEIDDLAAAERASVGKHINGRHWRHGELPHCKSFKAIAPIGIGCSFRGDCLLIGSSQRRDQNSRCGFITDCHSTRN